MMETHDFTVDLTWQEGRMGTIASPEVEGTHASIPVVTPPPFPGGVPGVWSPEHYFTAAVSACLMTTFLAIAENSGLGFGSFACRAVGRLGKEANRYKITDVTLYPVVEVRAAKDVDRAMKVLLKAEANCLITNSVSSAVHMMPEVRVVPELVDRP